MLRESQCRSQLEHQNTDQLSLSTSTGLKHKQTPARVTFLHPLPSSLGPRPDAAFTGSSVLSWRLKKWRFGSRPQPPALCCLPVWSQRGKKKLPRLVSWCVSARLWIHSSAVGVIRPSCRVRCFWWPPPQPGGGNTACRPRTADPRMHPFQVLFSGGLIELKHWNMCMPFSPPSVCIRAKYYLFCAQSIKLSNK